MAKNTPYTIAATESCSHETGSSPTAGSCSDSEYDHGTAYSGFEG
jgi:hypothetical protein